MSSCLSFLINSLCFRSLGHTESLIICYYVIRKSLAVDAHSPHRDKQLKNCPRYIYFDSLDTIEDAEGWFRVHLGGVSNLVKRSGGFGGDRRGAGPGPRLAIGNALCYGVVADYDDQH